MPYNKGDFTQQGIAGYVNGGLLLNNKRDVTTRISTDEESAGIDSVDIKIKDRLNDIEYHITGENLTEGENAIGGGGDTYLNPKISLTITAKPVGVSVANVGLILIDDDNKLVPCTPYEGLDMITNKTYTGYALFMGDDIEDGVFYSAITYEGSGVTYTYELDNCTVVEEGSLSFAITNPSQDASVSLSFAS